MELKVSKEYRLESKGEKVVYEGFLPEYMMKLGHACKKGFHIFRGTNNRRIAIHHDELKGTIFQYL